MPHRRAFLAATLALLSASSSIRTAFAGDDDLLDDEPAKPADKTNTRDERDKRDKTDKADTSVFGTYTPPVATIKGHAYTLAECLALTDRNFPNLWAARARLAASHAQLDEAKWTPFSQWTLNSTLTFLGSIGGTPTYTTSSQSVRNFSFTNLEPWLNVDLNGVIPLYTFGKISSIREAAEAQIRVNEWDLEKTRQQAHMDVRRAFFGAMLARDARYILQEVLEKLQKGIEGVAEKLRKNEAGVEEVDRFRLETVHDEIMAKSGEPEKGERYAMAALRFYTGVQTAFDIPDEPLKAPSVTIAPLVRYLGAARIFRPEVNMARAGVVARKAQADYARAQLFPDIGIGVGASYAVSPNATPQFGNIWANDPFNHFYAGGAFGLRWGLDFLPKSAKIAQAESQLEEVRSMERMALGGIAVEVENAYGVMLEAKLREESWARAEHRSKEWISTVSDAIDLGTKDEKALLEPLKVYMNARVQHEYALMDYNVAISELARVSGWDAAAPSGS